MKQVRLFVSAAALLMSGLLFAHQQGTWVAITSAAYPSYQLHATSRAQASLAIDTYGYFDIRVWIDGVMINRKPKAYVEIPSLRAGHRFVEIEVFGRHSSYFVSHQMFLEPHRWNLFEVQRHPHRNWFAISALSTKPIGYYYAGGRRTSVNMNVNRPVWRPGYGVGSTQRQQKNKHPEQHSRYLKRQESTLQGGKGRSNNRGGIHQNDDKKENRQPRGRGAREAG